MYQQWHQRRRLLQPIFARDHIAHYDAQITAVTSVMLNRWQQQVEQSKPTDVSAETTRLTLTIACKTFAVRWGTAVAADGRLRQAPFRSNIDFASPFNSWSQLGLTT